MIEISSETAEKLAALARQLGVSVEDFLRSAVPELTAAGPGKSDSAAQRAKALREWAEGHATNTPPLSDEAISRRSIYGG